MPDFLKLSAAAKRTGKSTSTIRRLIKSITLDDNHADRSHVRPSPKEVSVYEKDGIQFTWEISQDLLDREYPADAEKGSGGEKQRRLDMSSDKLVDTLNTTIGELTKQLSTKDEQLSDLQKSLQHAQMIQSQLAIKAGLPPPTPQQNSTPVSNTPRHESIWRRHFHLSDLIPWKW